MDEYPDQARQMFVEGLPHAFASDSPSSPAHDYQARFITLIESALQDARRFVAEKLATRQQQVEAEQTILQAEQASCSEATIAAEAALEVSAEAERRQKQTGRDTQDFEREHKEVERESVKVRKALDSLLEEKAKVAFVLEASFRMLAEGGWEDEEAKAAAIAAVVSYLEDSGAEKVLVAAASEALGTKTESRKRFDKVTVQHVGEVLEEKARAIDAKVEQATPAAEEANAELLGAWALADVAREDMARAEEAGSAAEAASKAARKTLQEAQISVRAHEAALKVAAAALEQATEKAQLVERGFAALEELKAPKLQPPAAQVADVGLAAGAAVEGVEISLASETGTASSKDVEMPEKLPAAHAVSTSNVLGVPTPMVP